MPRKPNAKFMKPMHVDTVLSRVVGNGPMPRTEVVKKVWVYVKKNGLQDKKERRMINCDGMMKDVCGGKGRVSMFEMTKLVFGHLKAA